MTLEGTFDGDVVRVGGDARQRLHDARGYGYPLDGNEIALAPVEAAHLLDAGVLDAVVVAGTRCDFREFVVDTPGTDFVVRYLVYADVRSRGLYLSPTDDRWLVPGIRDAVDDASDFVVYPRGKGPRDGEVAHTVRVIGERTDLPAADLAPGILAVVDEESEITYFSLERPAMDGSSTRLEDVDAIGDGVSAGPTATLEADLLTDRVVVWSPPRALYERTFFGQPLAGREPDEDRPALQCSLLEAAYLADAGVVDLHPTAVVHRGRDVEGDRFDRRLAVYTQLRDRGMVPKTGYKFGADFRTYPAVERVDSLGHSERLVRVLSPDHVFEPRDLALDVRLAHGVRKTMTFALVESNEDKSGRNESAATDERDDPTEADRSITWWSVERVTL